MRLQSRTTATRNRKKRYQSWYNSIPGWSWWIISVGVLAGFFSPHPMLNAFGWCILPVLVRLTWRKEEPPFLLVGVLKLWILVFLPTVYFSVLQGIPLTEIDSPSITAQLPMASALALGAVVAVAAGARVGVSGLPPLPWTYLRNEAIGLSPVKIFIAYLGTYVVDFLFGGGGLLQLGGLAQIAIAATLVRWAFFFLLVFVVSMQKKGQTLLTVAVAIEVVGGLLGFWGGFKDFFFIFVVAYLGARYRIRTQEVKWILALLLMLLVAGLFWQTVKSEYRSFLTGGEATLRVRVETGDQAEKLWELVKETRWEDMETAMDPTVDRMSTATIFFGEVVDYIPSQRPYDKGAGWKAGIEHILKPRLLFPNKPAVHASEITNRYIARTVSGAERGASFSIGYFGESYADFGPVGMFVPIFLVGIMFGLMYRFFLVYSHLKIFGLAFVTAFLLSHLGGIPDIPKLLGLTITEFVVMGAILYFLGPTIYKYIQR
jgi:hypothetical protein